MTWTGFSALACAAALAAACDGTPRDARHNTSVGTSGQTSHGQDGDARYLVERAAVAGPAEVELGRLAIERAQNPQVRAFAQTMVRDHSQALAELEQSVSGHDVYTPRDLDAEHRQIKERLDSLRGADFDREYMKVMVEGHKEVKSLFEDRPGSLRDPSAATPTGTSGGSSLERAVNQWAASALPRVNEHLQKAEEIYATVR